MAQVKVLTMDGTEAGTIDLKDEIFGIEPNENAVHAVVVNHLANKRQGTQSAKTRAEVRGGGRKPFRQKGTGRHRQGSSTDPTQVGGGVVFAPKPRSYRYTVPKKIRRLAMLSALSSKVKENEIIVLEDLKFDEPKTKEMLKVLAALPESQKLDDEQEKPLRVAVVGRHIRRATHRRQGDTKQEEMQFHA